MQSGPSGMHGCGPVYVRVVAWPADGFQEFFRIANLSGRENFQLCHSREGGNPLCAGKIGFPLSRE